MVLLFCEGLLQGNQDGNESLPFLLEDVALSQSPRQMPSRDLRFHGMPRREEVVSRSPTSIAPYCASTLQYTLPSSAMGCRVCSDCCLSSTIPGLYSPAPETTPATRLS